jgi:hypothetical protein
MASGPHKKYSSVALILMIAEASTSHFSALMRPWLIAASVFSLLST